jgi:hypothetical protein
LNTSTFKSHGRLEDLSDAPRSRCVGGEAKHCLFWTARLMVI